MDTYNIFIDCHENPEQIEAMLNSAFIAGVVLGESNLNFNGDIKKIQVVWKVVKNDVTHMQMVKDLATSLTAKKR